MGDRHVVLNDVDKIEQELDEEKRHCSGEKGAQVCSGQCRAHSARTSVGTTAVSEPTPGRGGKRESQQKESQGFAKVVESKEQQPVIMAAAAKVAKRVPLIKFPSRKAGETQGAVAVNRASGGGSGQSQPMSSLPSGTASSQPPRTTLTKAEIEAILLGGAAP